MSVLIFHECFESLGDGIDRSALGADKGGHTDGEVFVFGDLAALQAFSTPENCQKPAFVVAQTTFQVTKWEECSEFLKKAYTNAAIFDTICNATLARQKEAEELSRQCDLMVIIGGHHSSNTQKLVSVVRRFTRAVAVETASELSPAQLRGEIGRASCRERV